ncbi:hypothetical protein AB0O91_03180 [Kitasatospora sp. NPDC089797]|uniref:hypothetical protein n=1 Tax=Kitasatospora sp. NPDC089797 TaxID=3155298 RepID=UPI0034291F89
MTTPTPVRTHLADAVLALVAALALASPATPALAGPTHPGPAPRAGTCSQAVQETRADLANAGAPTGHTDWQGVRDDAQSFVDSHPYGGSGTQKLKSDIQNLNYYCAS